MATIKLKNAGKMWTARIRALRKVKKATPLQAAKLMQAHAKRNAPRKTGETIRGIKRRKAKNGWVVESHVRGRFKQNLFANQTAPYRTLRFKKSSKQPFFATPQTVVYGRSATTPSGKSVRWTGKARFWHFAALRTKKVYRQQATKNTRKALRVTT